MMIKKENLKAKNYRESAIDFLGNKFEIGDYVILKDAYYNNLVVAIVFGFTKQKVRIAYLTGRAPIPYLSMRIVEEEYLCSIDRDKISKEDLSIFKEIEEVITLPKKMNIL